MRSGRDSRDTFGRYGRAVLVGATAMLQAGCAFTGPSGEQPLPPPAIPVTPPPDGGDDAASPEIATAGSPGEPLPPPTAVAGHVAEAAGNWGWEPWFTGVSGAEIALAEPRPMRGWAVRVDGRAPGIEWVVTPSNGEKEGETDGLRTSSFLGRSGCQVAVNAAPFSPLALFEGRGHDVKGLQVSAGQPVSPAGSNPWLAIDRNGRAAVVEAGTDVGAGPWNAVAGFSVVLRAGEVRGGEGALHPRTAAGVSRDGMTVFLLVLDGRQDGFSGGATTADVGRLLLELGAWDGINLDGGGTTTLVVEDTNGQPKTLNRPIHGGIPGLERVSASHLGVRARRQ